MTTLQDFECIFREVAKWHSADCVSFSERKDGERHRFVVTVDFDKFDSAVKKLPLTLDMKELRDLEAWGEASIHFFPSQRVSIIIFEVEK